MTMRCQVSGRPGCRWFLPRAAILWAMSIGNVAFAAAGEPLDAKHWQRVIAAIILPGLQSAIEQSGGQFAGEKRARDSGELKQLKAPRASRNVKESNASGSQAQLFWLYNL